MASEQPCYTIINGIQDSETPNEQQLKHDLGNLRLKRPCEVVLLLVAVILSEHSDNRGKAAVLKKVIQLVLNGERLPGLLMTIIRFLLPCNDHEIKKLLLIFWEIWPKTSGDGKLLHEMILVCDAYRKVTC